MEKDNIWFAGFYEAEGTIDSSSVSLYQNDPYPLEYAQKIWGGRFTKRIRKSPASDKTYSSNITYQRHLKKFHT